MEGLAGGGGVPAIVFTGFMAAGKSTAARLTAEELGFDLLDADELLEAELGEPIAIFFEREGEAEFRRREEALVLGLLERKGDRVIALGGGAVESEAIRAALEWHVSAWCQVDEENAWRRAQKEGGRPLALDRDQFAARFAARAPLYEQTARAILPGGIPPRAARWLDAMRGTPGVRMVYSLSPGGFYPAAVGPGAIGLLDGAEPDRRRFAIADREVLTRHEALLPALEAAIQIEGGEERKTLTEAEVLLRALAEMQARRDDLILAFGGGVTGDLAGFVAATYQRGTPVVQLPTTVVAQVDSAYGGKTGVDLPEAKNYVGAYHQPLAVLADPTTLATLPDQEISAGFTEVLKTALIAGGELWERVRAIEDFRELVRAGGDELSQIIFACARVKLAVVAMDERDTGLRNVLNLGHTVGHAIEVATGYKRYRHGEAVGLGLLAALRLSEAPDLRAEVYESLVAHGLPTVLEGASVAEVIEASARDKKTTSEGLGFVLLSEPGEPRWGERVAADSLRAAVEELNAET